jgi:glycerol kinase
MKSGYILALDQGTTNTKAILVNREGQPTFKAVAPVRISSPQSNWIEQDPIELWNSVVSVAVECLSQISPNEVDAIGVSNQRETVVAWERATGNPVAPAIVWQCQRSAGICATLRAAGKESLVRARTGLPIDTLFSGGKIAWMLDQLAGLRSRAEAGEICFGTVDSWLIWNFTGGASYVSDLSNASRTQLLNIFSRDWDDDLLTLFRIPRVALPHLVPSSGVIAKTVSLGAIPAGIPVASAIGDSHAALAGHASYEAGTIKATYGTGSSLMTLVSTPKPVPGRLPITIAWSIQDQTQYALEGNITMTGAAIQWVGEFLHLADPVGDTLRLADTVSDSGEVYLVPAMVGLGAPHWDNAVRGTIFGLNRTSEMGNLALAAVESIAFQIRDVFDAMEREAGCMLKALHADGGASQNDRLMQFQADILGRPVIRSLCPDLSALGAAWLAGLAIGYWQSLLSLRGFSTGSRVFQPKLSEKERKLKYDGWLLSVARARFQPVTNAAPGNLK